MNPHSFFTKPTNPIEIINVINKLNLNKASGPFSVQPDILQHIKNIIADPLSKLINSSFESGIYFDNLKISKTIPIFKEKGDIFEKTNYQPISLLSNINKIVKKLMQERLYTFLTIHNCIYENQFGFRKKHSTIHALMSITEDIKQALDNNQIACGIFIELQKAFDTVNHEILIIYLFLFMKWVYKKR